MTRQPRVFSTDNLYNPEGPADALFPDDVRLFHQRRFTASALVSTKAEAVERMQEASGRSPDPREVRMNTSNSDRKLIDAGVLADPGDVVLYAGAQKDKAIFRGRVGEEVRHVATWRYTAAGLEVEVVDESSDRAAAEEVRRFLFARSAMGDMGPVITSVGAPDTGELISLDVADLERFVRGVLGSGAELRHPHGRRRRSGPTLPAGMNWEDALRAEARQHSINDTDTE